jgi:hypothetical protein
MGQEKRPFPFHTFKKANRTLLIAAIVCIVFVVFPYAHFTGNEISSDQKHWANLGGWIGGTLGPSLSFLALCAALLTSYFQTRCREDDAARDAQETLQRKELVLQLLHDEIEKRYKSVMRNGLRSIRECKDTQGKRLGIQGLQLRDDDLIIISIIASRFPDFYFLENPALVSEAINIHVRLQDIRDIQKTLLPASNQSEIDAFGDVPGATLATDQFDNTIDKLEESVEKAIQELRKNRKAGSHNP